MCDFKIYKFQKEIACWWMMYFKSFRKFQGHIEIDNCHSIFINAAIFWKTRSLNIILPRVLKFILFSICVKTYLTIIINNCQTTSIFHIFYKFIMGCHHKLCFFKILLPFFGFRINKFSRPHQTSTATSNTSYQQIN